MIYTPCGTLSNPKTLNRLKALHYWLRTSRLSGARRGPSGQLTTLSSITEPGQNPPRRLIYVSEQALRAAKALNTLRTDPRADG